MAGEAVIPREQIALPQATANAENVELEAEIARHILGEKAPPASPVVAVTTDTDATISNFDLDDEEPASASEASEHATLASVESIVEMGFDRVDVLLALFIGKCNEDLALEYLVSGILQGASAKIDLGGDAFVTSDEENMDEDDDAEGLSQEKREQIVIQRTQNIGFSEEEVAKILQVFRKDRMAALDLELAGPASACAAASARQVLTDAVQVSTRRASLISSNPSSIDISTQACNLAYRLQTTFRHTPTHISQPRLLLTLNSPTEHQETSR